MGIDVQEGSLDMGGKLKGSFKKVLFGDMENAKCIPAGLVKSRR